MTHRPAHLSVLVGVVLLAGCFVGGPFGSQGSTDGPRFEEVGAERGFDYTPSLVVSFAGRSGVFVTDFNNDNRPDVLAIGGEDPALFRNTGGSFERSDRLPPLDTTIKSALVFDYDNDGWEDVLFVPLNGTAAFLENRNGSFHKRDVGLDTTMDVAIGASAADYDRDGCLDLFVVQNGDWRDGVPKAALLTDSPEETFETDNGNPNLLYDGNCGSFERVENAGIEGPRWSLATSFVDFTDDGYPDIHVGNDFNSQVLYVNQQDGTFERRELPDTDRHAMASEVADVDGDGRLDVFVTNVHFDRRIRMQRNMPSMDNSGNNLLINRGNGTFTSEERAFGVRDGGWGWAAALVDLDNDADLDLVHTTKDYLKHANDTGFIEKVETRPRIWERTDRNFTRLNASEVGFETGSGRGIAHLDYDLDGDQDLIVATHVEGFKLYENRGTPGNWLQIELDGSGTPALGSQVFVTTENGTQYRIRTAEADYLSQDTRTLHFGLGDEATVDVRVLWPDGSERSLESVSPNQRLVIPREGRVDSVGTSRNRTDEGS